MLTKVIENNNASDIKMVVLTLLEHDYFYERISSTGTQIYSLNFKSRLAFFINLYQIINIIHKEKPDVIQSWMYHCDLISACLKVVFPSIKVVWNIRHSNLVDNVDKKSTIILAKILSKLSFIPDAIICGSTAAQRHHTELGYKTSKFKLIPNGFDTKLFSPDKTVKEEIRNTLNIPKDNILIGYIGREKKVKNQIDLLESFSIISRKYNTVNLLLIGKGIKEKYKDHGLVNEKVILLEESIDVHKYMKALDLFVLPSLSEGFPNVLGEAMSCEVTAISNDVGDSAKIINDMRLISKTGSIEDLIEKISWWLELNSETKSELCVRARKRIIQHYSIESIVNKYLYLYRSLSQNTKKARN